MQHNKLLHIFFDVDMRCSHEGLKELARKKRFSLADMKQGDCVIFVNRAFTRLKMFASSTKCILHIAEGNRRIEPETIKLLPSYLSGEELTYKDALEKVITDRFSRRGTRKKHENN